MEPPMIIQPGNIIVFLVVMAFFLTSRFLDQKDRKITKARKYIEKQSDNLKQTMDQRKKELEELDESIQGKEASTREMLKRVESLLQEIDAHSDDLMKLQAQLTHYHKILKDLSLLTEKAERRVQMIKQESRDLEDTESRLEQLQSHMLQALRQAETAKQDVEQAAKGALREFQEESDRIAEETRQQMIEEEQQRRPEPPPGPAPIEEQYPELEEVQKEPAQPIAEQAYSYEDIAQEETEELIPDEEDEIPDESTGTEQKRDLVKKLRDQGFDASQIAQRMGTSRGEVELLLEILRFSEDEK